MSFDENIADESGYTIDVNSGAAFSITYDDAHGRLVFGVEVGEDPGLIFLNSKPSDGNRMVNTCGGADEIRLNLAVKRVKAYFKAKGLRVEVD